MNCTHKPLLTLALALGIGFSSHAQTDTISNELNLGRLRIDKDFTQSITIKGTDLEKMPFNSLAEAINVWSYGYYTQQARLRYVIDGVIMNDVNAYSPYDIEEVTLVQNALGQVSGATSQQVLVLIKTRKGGNQPKGMTIAGQSYLVNTSFEKDQIGEKIESVNNFSHLYQVSAYQNGKHLQFGMSANYYRDVFPDPKWRKDAVRIPDNTDRFRINGWATAQLGNKHELTLRVNATPQVRDYELGTASGNYRYGSDLRVKQTILNPTIGLRSKLSDRLTNELTVSYGWQKGSIHQVSTSISTPVSSSTNEMYNTKNRSQQVLIMDHISYRAQLSRDWSIEPALNFSFRYLDREWETVLHRETNGMPTQILGNTISQEGRIYLVTPSVNLRYRNSFNLQGGVLKNISKTYGQNVNDLLPFVSTSIDLFRLARPDNPTSLKLFGSYAETDNTGDASLDLEATNYNGVPLLGAIPVPVWPGSAAENSFWNWQTGARLSLFNNRLIANYIFERRNFTAPVYNSSPVGGSTLFPDITSSSHYIGINAVVTDSWNFSWRTGINATSIKSKSDDAPMYSRVYGIYGDFNSDKTAWTGGWTNRITVGRFVAGADLLYYSNPDSKQTLLQDYGKLNGLALQNAYVGYNVPLKNKGNLELFVDARNLAQHQRFKMAGNRKYFGLGVKISL
ncbi:hypothetical protein [Paraflavitalea sp. CAU 1676]|uniref:hypothetical protein n=1 Tax=Paraflavitalea sp. CAU 1676 TaxID=3032598 RepID=UPI0023DBB40F|nr:hypothetical protein [Paraflavitalea sp. CAU 1676]MDF2191948.1 hypothetical protein [Paraflavitalea sp. CAU 1676]